MELFNQNYLGQKLSIPDAFYRISTKAIIKDNSGRLLVLRAHYDDSKVDTWELPGGGWDFADSDLSSSVARELFEELGLKLKRVSPRPLFLWRNQNMFEASGVYVVKIAYEVEVEPGLPVPSAEAVDFAYVTKKEFLALDFHKNELTCKEFVDVIFV